MKPRIRWVYVIQRDELEILGIRSWSRRDGKREKRRRTLRGNRAQKGL